MRRSDMISCTTGAMPITKNWIVIVLKIHCVLYTILIIAMTENSLAVSVLDNLPVIVFLMNNYMLGMVAQWQRTFYNRRYMGVHQNSCPDYSKIAEAYGAQGIKAQSVQELEKAIRIGLKSDVATVIDITIDPEEDVYPFVAPGTSLKDMITGA